MGLPFYIVTLLSIEVGEEGKRRVLGEGGGVEIFIGIPKGSLCGEEKHGYPSHAKV